MNPIGNKEGRKVMQKNPPIKIISTIGFHLTRVEMTMATAHQWLI
jgi:hypothetical protein